MFDSISIGGGLLTAFVAATIGLVQYDIKRVLAYSTVSQLGYMFVAMGVGAYTAGAFHLMTHAFFKALLFLGSGSVIHAMNHEQDMRRMGGLRAYMPVTFITMLIGSLAIAGIPPLAGFFSKDEILWNAYSSALGNQWLWGVGFLTAGLTSFYMFRAFFMIFNGRYDKRKNPGISVHESGLILLIPMGILAIASVIFGFLFNPTIDLGYKHHWFNYFIKPDFHAHEFDFGIAIISHLIVFLGILAAYLQYRYAKPVNSLIIKKFNKLLKHIILSIALFYLAYI